MEILKIIFDNVGPCDGYASIHYLCQLRLVNKTFAAMLAPKVFASIPFWLELESVGNLCAVEELRQL